uniref:Uncharacterized protein n=1 Tax=Panagrolaimus sp. PS1159 TaxID=55785 RepID=A0AC35FR11_9BILA
MAGILHEDANKVVEEFEKLRNKYDSTLNKSVGMLQMYLKELIDEPIEEVKIARENGEQNIEEPTLSVAAQVIIEKELQKTRDLVAEIVQEHRGLHKVVSRCGKDLDKNFEADLSGLLRNEKDAEGVLQNRQTINKLMYEYFLDTGMSDVAETLKKEAELPIDSKEEKASDDLKTVIELYRKREIIAVIEFLENSIYKKEAEYKNLLFDLHRQHVIFLLEQNKKNEALKYSRKLQPFASEKFNEISHLMGALVAYPDNDQQTFEKPLCFRYKNLFHPNNWLVVESNLAKLVSKINSPLEVLLSIGAKAMPSMLSIKNVLSRSLLVSSEELPISVEIPNPVHSTFTCPVLKVQATESNPPIRLGCGHVISKEAVNKLTANRPLRNSRNTRHGNSSFRCIYCPENINTHENKRIHFN